MREGGSGGETQSKSRSVWTEMWRSRKLRMDGSRMGGSGGGQWDLGSEKISVGTGQERGLGLHTIVGVKAAVEDCFEHGTPL